MSIFYLGVVFTVTGRMGHRVTNKRVTLELSTYLLVGFFFLSSNTVLVAWPNLAVAGLSVTFGVKLVYRGGQNKMLLEYLYRQFKN